MCFWLGHCVYGSDVRYGHASFGGNFKVWVLVPDGPGPFPVIIYNYDEYWDLAGDRLATQKGYDLRQFMREFERWGFISIIPVERYQKVQALKATVLMARQMPKALTNRLHLVGLSEGAFLSMKLSEDMPYIKSITVMSPMSIHSSGYYSISDLKRNVQAISIPILYIIGASDKKWRVSTSYALYEALKQSRSQVMLREYPENHRWFWNPDHVFMQDIHAFLKSIPE